MAIEALSDVKRSSQTAFDDTSALGKVLIAAADAAAARSTLELGTAATVNLTVSTVVPSSPAIGDLWVDTN